MAQLRLFWLVSFALQLRSPHVQPRLRRNMTPVHPTPRSRSATSCPIAARSRSMRRSAGRRPPYFKMINDRGGINGRRINFISYDDAWSPPKTVEQARKLVESDEVLLIFGARAPRPTPRSRNT